MPTRQPLLCRPRRRSGVAAGSVAIAVLTMTIQLVGVRPAQGGPAGAPAPAARPQQVTVGRDPVDIAVAQNLGRAFVVNDDSISVVSLLTRRRLAEFSGGGGAGQHAIALVQGNTQGYVTHSTGTYVSVVDTETQKPLRQLDVGAVPLDVTKANTPRGQRAYVSLRSVKAVAVVQTKSGEVLPRVRLPHPAAQLVAQPGGTYVWAGSLEHESLLRISTTTGKVTSFPLDDRIGPPVGLAFTRNGRYLWTSGPAGLGRLDTRTGKVSKRLKVLDIFCSSDPNLGQLALGNDGRYLYAEDNTYVENPKQGSVAAIDTRTMKVSFRVRTGTESNGLAIDTRRNVAYAPNYADGTLTWFSGAR